MEVSAFSECFLLKYISATVYLAIDAEVAHRLSIHVVPKGETPCGMSGDVWRNQIGRVALISRIGCLDVDVSREKQDQRKANNTRS